MITTNHTSISYKNVLYCRGVSEVDTHLEAYLTTIGLTRPLTKDEIKTFGLHGAKMFIDNEKDSFYYGKITRDNRFMIGFGDVQYSPKKHPPQYVHLPHVRALEARLKKHHPSLLPLEFTWSAPYALSTYDVPLVNINKTSAVINGGGTQSTSIVAARYAVMRLTKKSHPLKKLFTK